MSVFIYATIIVSSLLSILYVTSQQHIIVGLVFGILAIIVLYWWFIGKVKSFCDWCLKPILIRRNQYYSSQNHLRERGDPTFCCSKCCRTYEVSKSIGNKRRKMNYPHQSKHRLTQRGDVWLH
jgi:hypothetical protein